ncbi:MAG: galactokinase [Candidatus Abyssobacteria bacterium SURF_17]|uniref:Galactokinase n=1 Tax=Candidatus Abyssobacteria bacterium SURF_17 TaxID=2093361 RepID=A0A419F2Q9_9BACT|nr:MAG: galactokinase [Candidatus Abyssubacteria bacterium SURF_17]
MDAMDRMDKRIRRAEEEGCRNHKMESLLLRQFRERFGGKPEAKACAPGRVNLIGEHTDYNDGYVLPIAISRRICAAASKSGTETVTLRSGNLKGEVAFDVGAIKPSGDWGDYPKGIVAKLRERRFPVRGFNACFLSNVPIGAGVSSSAAMEVVVCHLLEKLFGFSIPPEDEAVLCQQAEHEFAGTRCGIMDQFVSILGRADSALFLDCRTLRYEHVPFSLGDCVLVACDSRVERGLATSEYNRRRAECEQGVKILSERFPAVKALRDATVAEVEECSHEMPEEIFRRCRHVVTENARVLETVEAMRENRRERIGELMNLSHDSLRDDYCVSCAQLDLLVDTARSIDGVLGSRLTGAGFGGSTISLVHRSAIDEFQNGITEAYLKAFDTAPRFFECIASDGAERANKT